MLVEGNIVRIDQPESDHHKFDFYLLIKTKTGTIGLQVRRKNSEEVKQIISEGIQITAKIHTEHHTRVSNGNGKTYYYNNLILDKICTQLQKQF